MLARDVKESEKKIVDASFNPDSHQIVFVPGQNPSAIRISGK